MAVRAGLDRDVIVERAEAVRFWLLSYTLSPRATSAIQRELGAIIDNIPSSAGAGPRPLAGLTAADFVDELHSPQGGAVGRVKGVSDAALRELRAAIRPGAVARRHAPELELPELELPELELPELELPDLEPPDAGAPVPEYPAAAQAEPRGRGRPRGSAKALRDGAQAPQATAPAAGAPRRRGRPRKAEATALPAARAQLEARSAAPEPPAAPRPDAGDQCLDDLMQQWPGLHPHARRAVVLYASTLLAEAAYSG